jgi:hypothetical protein
MHTSIDSPAGELGRAAREIVTCSVAAVGLAGIALIHLLDSLGKFHRVLARRGRMSLAGAR